MTNKTHLIPMGFLMSLVFSVFVTTRVSAQVPELVEAIKEARDHRIQMLQQVQREARANNKTSVCTAMMTITSVEDGGAHFEEGNSMIVVGPLPVSQALQISPIGGAHPWEPGDYFFSPNPADGDFKNENVWVNPHNGGSRRHEYRVSVEDMDNDNCPTEIKLTGWHADSVVLDDPGHATATK